VTTEYRARTRRLLAASIALAAFAAVPQLSFAATVLITGANSGLGLEFAKQYAAKGWTVIATHRRSGVPESLAPVVAEFKNVRVEHLDVTSADDVKALAAKLKDVPIDLLINNAGVYNDRSACKDDACIGDWNTQNFGELHYDLLDTIMAVNVKGPLMVSEALLGNVKASTQKKIIAISSTNGSLTDQLAGSGAIFYRASKAALNRAMQLVATKEKTDGVTVVMLHPGAVVTERQAYLEGFKGMVEMPFSVEHMIATIDKLTIADSGKFLNYDGTTAPW
jgi:NAD(P)-dependent dehydrogenase (short-subunit alcohol dehydrogenase family)